MSQQIVIDSVYPEVAEFYKEIGLYYEPKALDRNKFRFDVLCKDRPIRKRIDQIYRYKSGGLGQEYIYYSELWEGTDHVGNDQNWGPWIVGRVDIPYAHYRWVEETHTREATEIEGFNTKYLIPFNEQNLISVEVHGEKREVSSEFHNGTKFYVSDGDRIYGGLITEEIFRTWPFEDIVYYIKTGMKPGTQIVTPDAAEEVKRVQEEKQKLDAAKQKLEDEKKKR